MPTKNPRVTFTLDQETLNRIDDFRFSAKSKNQTQAILRLLDAGLSAFETETKKSPHQPKPVRGIYLWKNQMHFWSLSGISSPVSKSLMMTFRFSGTLSPCSMLGSARDISIA